MSYFQAQVITFLKEKEAKENEGINLGKKWKYSYKKKSQ